MTYKTYLREAAEQNSIVPIYRGMMNPPGVGTVLTPRKDRRPMDTRLLEHKIVSELLREAGKPGRDEVLFGTPNKFQAEQYGDAVILTPEPGTKIWVNPQVLDYTSQFNLEHHLRPIFEKYRVSDDDWEGMIQEVLEEFWDFLVGGPSGAKEVELPDDLATKKKIRSIYTEGKPVLQKAFGSYVDGMREVTAEELRSKIPNAELLIDGPVKVTGAA